MSGTPRPAVDFQGQEVCCSHFETRAHKTENLGTEIQASSAGLGLCFEGTLCGGSFKGKPKGDHAGGFRISRHIYLKRIGEF